jgi:hypothetical protein
MDERRLEQLARGLGRKAAEDIDVESTAKAVLHRVRTEPVRVVWWRRTPVLQGLAAAAVVAITAGILVTSVLERNVSGPVSVPAVTELADLSVEELEEVFDSLAVEAPVYELADAGLYDLTESELEELLQLLEG